MTAAGAAGASVAGHAARLAARAGQVALCLDFDGTLSPIVPDPEAARPLEGVAQIAVPGRGICRQGSDRPGQGRAFFLETSLVAHDVISVIQPDVLFGHATLHESTLGW